MVCRCVDIKEDEACPPSEPYQPLLTHFHRQESHPRYVIELEDALVQTR